MDEAEDAEIERLYADAQLAEHRLKELEKENRDPNAIRGSRAMLLLLYESLMLTSVSFAENNAIEDKLWIRVIYPVIEELRGHVRRAQETSSADLHLKSRDLTIALDEAEAIYSNLILELRLREGLDFEGLVRLGVKRFLEGETGVPGDPENTLTGVHRALIRLGDIARYRSRASNALLPESPRDTAVAHSLYQRAFVVNPISGRPQSQLPLAISDDHPFAMTYWYCLSMASTQPFVSALANLRSMFVRLAGRLHSASKRILEVDDESSCEVAVARLLLAIRHALFFDSMGSENLRDMYTGVKESVPAMVRHASQGDLRHIMVCLVVVHEDLNTRFRAATLPPMKEATRHMQSFIFAVIIDLFCFCGDAILRELTLGGWSSFEGDATPRLSDSRPFEALAIVPWLSKHLDEAVRTFGEYASWYAEEGFFVSEFVKERSTRLCRSVCDLCNTALEGYVLETLECLPDDVELLGIQACRAFYTLLDQDSILDAFLSYPKNLRVSQNIEKLMSRALLLGRSFVERDLLFFDLSKETFVVSTRDRPLRNPNLPEEVEDDEGPRVVVGSDVLVDDLDSLKAWVDSRTCQIVVPLSAIDALDSHLDGDGVAAAERVLRDGSAGGHLRRQLPEEASPVEDALALAGIDHVPQRDKSVLSCSLYFFGDSAGDFADTGDFRGALVTDDGQLSRVATICGIPTMTTKQLGLWARKQRRILDVRAKTRTLRSTRAPHKR
ncbi:hypothetical protein DFJ74DRAFT_44017 [Hyaloraphidium curvatum]|nr:hypothetical protein DFJ74DRAFT_44017 [Hyaloraphidium curvatum]